MSTSIKIKLAVAGALALSACDPGANYTLSPVAVGSAPENARRGYRCRVNMFQIEKICDDSFEACLAECKKLAKDNEL